MLTTSNMFVIVYLNIFYVFFNIHKDMIVSISEERKLFIRKTIKDLGTVTVNSLAEELEVSEMTIRRDLSELENEGFLKRIHGGAVHEASRSYEPPFFTRKTFAAGAKQAIAEKAVKYIEEGDLIAIDSGTTALEFARQLKEHKNLTIVTPSIHVASVFLSNPSVETILAGGRIRTHEGSLVGDITRSVFEKLYFDKFFLSTAALSLEAGYSEYIMEDAEIKKLIVSHSKKTIALMHSDKLDRTAFCNVCRLEEAAVLITDKFPKGDIKSALLENGVIIETADHIGD